MDVWKESTSSCNRRKRCILKCIVESIDSRLLRSLIRKRPSQKVKHDVGNHFTSICTHTVLKIRPTLLLNSKYRLTYLLALSQRRPASASDNVVLSVVLDKRGLLKKPKVIAKGSIQRRLLLNNHVALPESHDRRHSQGIPIPLELGSQKVQLVIFPVVNHAAAWLELSTISSEKALSELDMMCALHLDDHLLSYLTNANVSRLQTLVCEWIASKPVKSMAKVKSKRLVESEASHRADAIHRVWSYILASYNMRSALLRARSGPVLAQFFNLPCPRLSAVLEYSKALMHSPSSDLKLMLGPLIDLHSQAVAKALKKQKGTPNRFVTVAGQCFQLLRYLDLKYLRSLFRTDLPKVIVSILQYPGTTPLLDNAFDMIKFFGPDLKEQLASSGIIDSLRDITDSSRPANVRLKSVYILSKFSMLLTEKATQVIQALTFSILQETTDLATRTRNVTQLASTLMSFELPTIIATLQNVDLVDSLMEHLANFSAGNPRLLQTLAAAQLSSETLIKASFLKHYKTLLEASTIDWTALAYFTNLFIQLCETSFGSVPDLELRKLTKEAMSKLAHPPAPSHDPQPPPAPTKEHTPSTKEHTSATKESVPPHSTMESHAPPLDLSSLPATSRDDAPIGPDHSSSAPPGDASDAKASTSTDNEVIEAVVQVTFVADNGSNSPHTASDIVDIAPVTFFSIVSGETSDAKDGTQSSELPLPSSSSSPPPPSTSHAPLQEPPPPATVDIHHDESGSDSESDSESDPSSSSDGAEPLRRRWSFSSSFTFNPESSKIDFCPAVLSACESLEDPHGVLKVMESIGLWDALHKACTSAQPHIRLLLLTLLCRLPTVPLYYFVAKHDFFSLCHKTVISYQHVSTSDQRQCRAFALLQAGARLMRLEPPKSLVNHDQVRVWVRRTIQYGQDVPDWWFATKILDLTIDHPDLFNYTSTVLRRAYAAKYPPGMKSYLLPWLRKTLEKADLNGSERPPADVFYMLLKLANGTILEDQTLSMLLTPEHHLTIAHSLAKRRALASFGLLNMNDPEMQRHKHTLFPPDHPSAIFLQFGYGIPIAAIDRLPEHDIELTASDSASQYTYSSSDVSDDDLTSSSSIETNSEESEESEEEGSESSSYSTSASVSVSQSPPSSPAPLDDGHPIHLRNDSSSEEGSPARHGRRREPPIVGDEFDQLMAKPEEEEDKEEVEDVGFGMRRLGYDMMGTRIGVRVETRKELARRLRMDVSGSEKEEDSDQDREEEEEEKEGHDIDIDDDDGDDDTSNADGDGSDLSSTSSGSSSASSSSSWADSDAYDMNSLMDDWADGDSGSYDTFDYSASSDGESDPFGNQVQRERILDPDFEALCALYPRTMIILSPSQCLHVIETLEVVSKFIHESSATALLEHSGGVVSSPPPAGSGVRNVNNIYMQYCAHLLSQKMAEIFHSRRKVESDVAVKLAFAYARLPPPLPSLRFLRTFRLIADDHVSVQKVCPLSIPDNGTFLSRKWSNTPVVGSPDKPAAVPPYTSATFNESHLLLFPPASADQSDPDLRMQIHMLPDKEQALFELLRDINNNRSFPAPAHLKTKSAIRSLLDWAKCQFSTHHPVELHHIETFDHDMSLVWNILFWILPQTQDIMKFAKEHLSELIEVVMSDRWRTGYDSNAIISVLLRSIPAPPTEISQLRNEWMYELSYPPTCAELELWRYLEQGNCLDEDSSPAPMFGHQLSKDSLALSKKRGKLLLSEEARKLLKKTRLSALQYAMHFIPIRPLKEMKIYDFNRSAMQLAASSAIALNSLCHLLNAALNRDSSFKKLVESPIASIVTLAVTKDSTATDAHDPPFRSPFSVQNSQQKRDDTGRPTPLWPTDSSSTGKNFILLIVERIFGLGRALMRAGSLYPKVVDLLLSPETFWDSLDALSTLLSTGSHLAWIMYPLLICDRSKVMESVSFEERGKALELILKSVRASSDLLIANIELIVSSEWLRHFGMCLLYVGFGIESEDALEAETRLAVVALGEPEETLSLRAFAEFMRRHPELATPLLTNGPAGSFFEMIEAREDRSTEDAVVDNVAVVRFDGMAKDKVGIKKDKSDVKRSKEEAKKDKAVQQKKNGSYWTLNPPIELLSTLPGDFIIPMMRNCPLMENVMAQNLVCSNTAVWVNSALIRARPKEIEFFGPHALKLLQDSQIGKLKMSPRWLFTDPRVLFKIARDYVDGSAVGGFLKPHLSPMLLAQACPSLTLLWLSSPSSLDTLKKRIDEDTSSSSSSGNADGLGGVDSRGWAVENRKLYLCRVILLIAGLPSGPHKIPLFKYFWSKIKWAEHLKHGQWHLELAAALLMLMDDLRSSDLEDWTTKANEWYQVIRPNIAQNWPPQLGQQVRSSYIFPLLYHLILRLGVETLDESWFEDNPNGFSPVGMPKKMAENKQHRQLESIPSALPYSIITHEDILPLNVLKFERGYIIPPSTTPIHVVVQVPLHIESALETETIAFNFYHYFRSNDEHGPTFRIGVASSDAIDVLRKQPELRVGDVLHSHAFDLSPLGFHTYSNGLMNPIWLKQRSVSSDRNPNGFITDVDAKPLVGGTLELDLHKRWVELRYKSKMIAIPDLDTSQPLFIVITYDTPATGAVGRGCGPAFTSRWRYACVPIESLIPKDPVKKALFTASLLTSSSAKPSSYPRTTPPPPTNPDHSSSNSLDAPQQRPPRKKRHKE